MSNILHNRILEAYYERACELRDEGDKKELEKFLEYCQSLGLELPYSEFYQSK